jgi:glycosyltransferase involved in cell wall biosynthesis
MGTYLREESQIPVILDLMDAAALNMSDRAASAPIGMRQLLDLEARRLGELELKLIEESDLSLLISERDRVALGSPVKTRVNPNGIDPPPAIADSRSRERSTVILTGTMSYFANADAAVWFASSILPSVKTRIPNVKFRIVGRDPGRRVRSLSTTGITVTGPVANIADELRYATVAVCPIRRGSGLSTKVLEAMATGTPVIGTSKAVEGLPDSLARFVVVADDARAFASAVVRNLEHPGPGFDRASLGLAEIRRAHTWRHSVDQLEACYEEAIKSHGIRHRVSS